MVACDADRTLWRRNRGQECYASSCRYDCTSISTARPQVLEKAFSGYELLFRNLLMILWLPFRNLFIMADDKVWRFTWLRL
jgi:hypothetical protein